MYDIPVNYAQYNAYNSVVSPSTVHVKNTGLAQFFKRYLLQQAMSVFEWKMPEYWARNYVLTVLYVWGFIFVMDDPSMGVIPQHGALRGYDVQYQPTTALINNPLFGSKELEIGTQCEILRLQPDYFGLYDLIDYYGDMMALIAETTGVNILNSKLSYVFGAANKAAAESFKKLYDQIASGQPAAFVDKQLFDEDGRLTVELLEQNVGQNFIADKLLDAMATVRNQFLTAIGIPNANTDKRERLISSEVESNDFETRSAVCLWLDELKKGCKKVRDLFGIELDVDWRKDLKGGEADGSMGLYPGDL